MSLILLNITLTSGIEWNRIEDEMLYLELIIATSFPNQSSERGPPANSIVNTPRNQLFVFNP